MNSNDRAAIATINSTVDSQTHHFPAGFYFWNPINPLEFENTTDLSPSSKLGYLAEACFAWLVEQSNRYEPVLRNVQIIDCGKTLGELDFILFDKQMSVFMHVELACKFYLLDASIGLGENAWIGPNRKDSLKLKCEKLKKNQFPLLYKEACQTALEQRGIDIHNIRQYLRFICFAFTPIGFHNWDQTAISREAHAGFWYTMNEFKERLNDGDQFYLPAKLEWLNRPELCEQWSTVDDTLASIEVLHRRSISPMVWIKHNDQSHERAFVVWW